MDVPVIETLLARLFADPRFAGLRRIYAGAVVATALALAGWSVLTPQIDWEVAEIKVADQAGTAVSPAGMAESLSLVQARTQLTTNDALARVAQAIGQREPLQPVDILVGPALGDSQATMIRVRDRNPGRASAIASALANRLAVDLNTADRADLDQHRRQLIQRVDDAKSRVRSAEQSLSLLMSDFRSALAQARQAPPPRIEPAPVEAPAPKREIVRIPPQVNPAWATLRERVDQMQRQLDELLVRFTDDNPRVQMTRLQLEQLERQLQGVPQYLTSSSPAPLEPAAGPELTPPREEPVDLPIAGRATIRRTSGEAPLPATPDLTRFNEEFAVVTALLEKARSEQATLQQELTRSEQFAASFPADRFLPASNATVVRRLQSLPSDAVRMVGCLAAACGAFFGLVAFRSPQPKLSSAHEIAAAMGLPVIVSVIRHGSPDERRLPEPALPRMVILAAEFAVIAIATAFAVSYATDVAFAELAGKNPVSAVAAIWNRNLL